MKKHSIFSIMILFGLLVGLSGCTQQPTEEKVVTGINGVVISFDEGMPPSSIYQDEQFDIGVIADNKGKATVGKDELAVHIIGLLLKEPGVEGSKSSYNLNGKEMTYSNAKKVNSDEELLGAYIEGDNVIPGDSYIFDWIGLEYLPPILSGKYNALIDARSCYKYSTTARAPICVARGKNLRTAVGSNICELNGDKTVTNDAAPVHVSKVTEYSQGTSGIKLIIRLQDVGTGTVYDYKSKGTDCINLDRKYQDKVYINSVKIGNSDILSTCRGLLKEQDSYYINLREGVKEFSCVKTDLSEKAGAAQENLNIELSYGYSSGIHTSMDINAIY